VSTLIIMYFGVFAPLLRKVDSDLKCTREMLLFFPDEVVDGVAVIKKTMREYARERTLA
jgi:hypothetical protein